MGRECLYYRLNGSRLSGGKIDSMNRHVIKIWISFIEGCQERGISRIKY